MISVGRGLRKTETYDVDGDGEDHVLIRPSARIVARVNIVDGDIAALSRR